MPHRLDAFFIITRESTRLASARRQCRDGVRATQVKNFLKDCGNEFLQELLIPSRLDKAMKALDTDGSGVIEIEEWYRMRRPFS